MERHPLSLRDKCKKLIQCQIKLKSVFNLDNACFSGVTQYWLGNTSSFSRFSSMYFNVVEPEILIVETLVFWRLYLISTKYLDNIHTMCKYIAQFYPVIRATNETNSGIEYSR